MKKLRLPFVSFTILFSVTTTQAFTRIVCDPTAAASSQDVQVEILFASQIDASKPLIGRYELLGKFKITDFKRQRNYERTDLKLYPQQGSHDVNLQGGAGGYVHVRLSPVFDSGTFTGHYHSQIFVNDLDTKAYYNLMGSSQNPGLKCQVF